MELKVIPGWLSARLIVKQREDPAVPQIRSLVQIRPANAFNIVADEVGAAF